MSRGKTSSSTLPLNPAGSTNRLLAALPPRDYRRLAGEIEVISLEMKQTLVRQDEPIEHVFFPLTAVSSLCTVMRDGAAVEIATVGNEGMIGVALLLGAERVHYRAFCQIPGQSARLSAAAFRKELSRRDAALRELMRRYMQAWTVQLSQGVACNRLHTIEQRCARWLLQTQDRVGGDNGFPLTQDFLAQMLGVRRASVNVVAGMLEKAGMIHYKRGWISVLDRKRLERTSCECYDVIRQESRRILE